MLESATNVSARSSTYALGERQTNLYDSDNYSPFQESSCSTQHPNTGPASSRRRTYPRDSEGNSRFKEPIKYIQYPDTGSASSGRRTYTPGPEKNSRFNESLNHIQYPDTGSTSSRRQRYLEISDFSRSHQYEQYSTPCHGVLSQREKTFEESINHIQYADTGSTLGRGKTQSEISDFYHSHQHEHYSTHDMPSRRDKTFKESINHIQYLNTGSTSSGRQRHSEIYDFCCSNQRENYSTQCHDTSSRREKKLRVSRSKRTTQSEDFTATHLPKNSPLISASSHSSSLNGTLSTSIPYAGSSNSTSSTSGFTIHSGSSIRKPSTSAQQNTDSVSLSSSSLNVPQSVTDGQSNFQSSKSEYRCIIQ